MMSQKPQIPKISELQMQLKAWLAGDRKTLIQNGIIAAAFLGFIFFFFLPVWSHNQKTAAQVKDLKERIQSADVKIARIPEMNRQKEMYGARTKETREQFFDAKDTEKLIEIISTTAASAGVKISASRPTDKTVAIPLPFDQTYVPVGYELIVEGGYHHLGLFINHLEQYPKHFAVFKLEVVKNEKVENIHRATLFLTAFLKRG